jgi:hypothetical protein
MIKNKEFTMSTRSLINVKCNDSKVRSIYVHFDGYGHLNKLNKYYNSQELAEQLIALGDLSVLDKYVENPPKGHSFKNPVEGHCVAYGRDRCEKNTEALVFDDFRSARKQNRSQEYIYEWDGRWHKTKIKQSHD